ncbi:ABC transporter permease subunit [Streptomyces sp. NPDC049585]|uniref:ABC transporter permease n=1 Tax=Streptomyces sp. NPDC049585 TaxID=3155154 RepID=UPI00343F55E8
MSTVSLYHPTVARLTYRGLLGRRRAVVLFALPALLLVLSAAVRAFTGADDDTAVNVLGGFALATMVPLVGVVAGTGAIGPEIDDGSVVYLLAKPVPRTTVVLTKLVVAIGVSIAFTALPTLLAGFLLNGNSQQIAVAYAAAAAAASVAYSALFLLLGVVTRHAVVAGLVYALVWESLFGNLIPGARTLSVQQWALSLAQRIGADGVITSDVRLPVAVTLLAVVTVAATTYAVHRMKSLTLAGEE